jgi:hypothetical protein
VKRWPWGLLLAVALFLLWWAAIGRALGVGF